MADILNLIRNRKSLRVPFDPDRPVAREDLLKILEAARWSPTAHNMQNFEIIVVDDPEILQAIGNIKRPISETFIRENYPHLSFSEEELSKKKTGLLATMFPPSWRNPDFRLTQTDEKETASLQRPMPESPALLVVVYDPGKRAPASEGDFLGIISLGCALENMWLMAESLGIGLHIVSSLGSAPEVKTILRIPHDLIIAFSCRFGYPVSRPAKHLQVRRDVKDFAHHNRFGAREKGFA
ncbi:MAG: nitroreductase family protein [Desulfobacterales bacterium]|nr:nitroreductase family protein [Desulfobacterales bacterium]